ncbi:MAG: serine/threonine protein kinase [Acidobacteria bacterium]|nr:serine/threonine protein kinase [Acidobacteriota bacterium]
MSDARDRGEGGPASLPRRFGAYRVEGLIGAGGMGIVYLALDEALQRQVALKTLLPALTADPEFVARFKREAQSAAALNHPNITQIYAIGQEGMIPFFAMELIRGRSLEGLVKDRGALDPLEAAGYISQAARGLRHAAEKKLIHRDVKPSNLMLTEDGVVKITDFGLAKAARSETQLTATGEVLGSPGYISPEQAQGAPLDARSDIYSLGATFYYLVTGRLPYEAPTPVAMIIKHMNEPLRSPRAINPAIPYPIAAAIQKMMAKRPGERFQDYEALVRELERAVSGPPSALARPAGARPVAGIPARPRGPQGRPAPDAPEGRARGISWIPMFLAAALGILVTAGIVHQRRAAVRSRGDAASRAAPQATSGPAAGAADAPIQAQGSFSTRPIPGAPGGHEGGGLSLEERLRQRFQKRNRANLLFVDNDHEILPDGRLRVFGRVTNAGGTAASRARVRIRILLESGAVVAQGETPLTPATIPAGASADFDLPIDYSGPVGTIKAELVWVE